MTPNVDFLSFELHTVKCLILNGSMLTVRQPKVMETRQAQQQHWQHQRHQTGIFFILIRCIGIQIL